jgi:hypothetical protein
MNLTDPAAESHAEGIRACKPLLTRYLVGFTDSNRTAQAENLPNHVAWSLGHLAITMHRVSEKIDGLVLPESDFVRGPAGDAQRFGDESVSFNSVPINDTARYPTLARSIAIYEAACDRLAINVLGLTPEGLSRSVPWGQGTSTLGALVQRMTFHNGMHCGQIADLRRALKMRSIFA